MPFRVSSDKFVIFSYFVGIILAGSLLLSLPFAWKGSVSLPYIDALFTATSAVCVTGLITVDTALYSRFGQAVIVLLIQFGGLGIITFATMYLAGPRRKISLVNRAIIKDYYLEEVEYNPKVIIRQILLVTLAIEGMGAFVLWLSFRGLPDSLFVAVFHAVSAFCNAGFSTFSTNLEGYVGDLPVNLTMMLLIVLGGLGFIVFRDLLKRWTGKKRRLSTHTRIVLAMTAFLILGGALVFFILESGHAFKGLSTGTKILASFLQSVAPRTAGFDTVLPAKMGEASTLVTMILMFVGASPGSTGGGIKTTTFFILVMAALRGVDEGGRLNVGQRAISPASTLKALGILGKGLLIVFVSASAILLLERQALAAGRFGLIDILYEVISAFGTVGLSLGPTPMLVPAAKFILILTMFAGRVGLFAMALPSAKRHLARYASLPEAGVLVG
jgi:trk system potassium uptake protein TrkH